MNTTDTRSESTVPKTRPAKVDLKLEVVIIPVSDVDRAKAFYQDLDWRLDADFAFDNGVRIVQVTPPGSPTSVQFGIGMTTAPPGSAQGLYLVCSDIAAAHDALAARGVAVSDVFHPGAPGAQFTPADASSRIPGPDDGRSSYGSFATFTDPDGNQWLLQEITTRLPGRVDSDLTSYNSVDELKQALVRAAAAHGQHEERTGRRDEEWPDWYAGYLVAEQSGEPLPT